MPTPTDTTELVERARTGDGEAQNELFERYYPTVQQLVHKGLAADLRAKRPWLGALFSTRDVVQDVFIGVIKDIDRFRGSDEADFVGYLATLTRNRLLDTVRFHQAVIRDRRRVAGSAEYHDIADPQSDPQRSAMSAEEVAQFCRALNEFEERDRLLLRGRLEQDTKFADLARQLGYASADSARKSFYIAQARLLVKLGVAKGRQA